MNNIYGLKKKGSFARARANDPDNNIYYALAAVTIACKAAKSAMLETAAMADL